MESELTRLVLLQVKGMRSSLCLGQVRRYGTVLRYWFVALLVL